MQKLLLGVFFFCLFACATLVIYIIWTEPPTREIFRVTANLFVVGLASFLVWIVTILKKIM